MSASIAELSERIERLEQSLSRSRIAMGAVVAGSVLALCGAALVGQVRADGTDGVLRARGLVIEDEAGRPRILIGAPAPRTAARNRTDDLVGLVYLDENGADRLTLGAYPDPMTSEGTAPRRVGGAGLLIHDREGIERGGYGVLDDDTALLTLDWPRTGEGAVISAGEQFAGVGVFHRSEPGVYREAVTMGAIREGEQGFIKMTDAAGVQRLRVELEGTGTPELQVYDEQGSPGRAPAVLE